MCVVTGAIRDSAHGHGCQCTNESKRQLTCVCVSVCGCRCNKRVSTRPWVPMHKLVKTSAYVCVWVQVQEKSQHMAMGALPAALTVVLQDELVELAQAGGARTFFALCLPFLLTVSLQAEQMRCADKGCVSLPMWHSLSIFLPQQFHGPQKCFQRNLPVPLHCTLALLCMHCTLAICMPNFTFT